MKAPESRWVVWHGAKSRFLNQHGNCSQGGRERFGYCHKTATWFASRWKLLLSRGQIEYGMAKIVQLDISLLIDDHPRSKGGLINLNVKISWTPPIIKCGVSVDMINLLPEAPPMKTCSCAKEIHIAHTFCLRS